VLQTLISMGLGLTLAASAAPSGPHTEQALRHRGEAPQLLPEPTGAALPRVSPALARRVYGYLPYWTTSSAATLRWDLLSDVLHFDAQLATDGHVTTSNGWATNNLVKTAHQYGAKAHLCATATGGPDTLLSSATARQTAITALVALVKDAGGDGLNIDFEFVSSAHAADFVTFIQDAATALHAALPAAELTLAMPAYPPWYPGYDVPKLAAASDRLLVMEYDFHWSGSSSTGPVAPLTGGTNWSLWVEKAMGTGNGFLGKTTPDKLALGVPYYGYDWPTSSETAVPATATAKATAVVYKKAVVDAATNGRNWDPESQTPWYHYNNGAAHQVWYDDAESLRAKYAWTNQQNLAGIMIWALGYDDGRTELWDEIQAAFGASGGTDGGTVADAGPRPDGGQGGGDAGINGTDGGGPDGSSCTPSNGGVEICDGQDNNCNGLIDENVTCPGGEVCDTLRGRCISQSAGSGGDLPTRGGCGCGPGTAGLAALAPLAIRRRRRHRRGR
jgi:spore germination protein YaaH